MSLEERCVYYDSDLNIEAYCFSNRKKIYPNHFHPYYVFGIVTTGQTSTHCKGCDYVLDQGDFFMFNPHDNHSCCPTPNSGLGYHTINIETTRMKELIEDILGDHCMPYFQQNIFPQNELAFFLDDLFYAIQEQAPLLEREEKLFLFLEELLKYHTQEYKEQSQNTHSQIQKLCLYIQDHYLENMTLDDFSKITHYGKSYLIKLFTKEVGVTPYRYVQMMRLDQAKNLLKEGVSLIDAAQQSGFSDQSHFTHFFRDYIGLTPKQYQNIFRENSEHEK